MKKDVIIIGGSAAGLTTAITARRHYPTKNILIIRKEKKVSIPCGIPYIFGTVGTPEKNLIPDGILDKNNIELKIANVIDIDRDKKIVITEAGTEIEYNKLILATGSEPSKPNIKGNEKDNIFIIYKDVDYLQKVLEKLNSASNLLIVGGGFIGVEFADECRKNRDINITIVEMLPHCLMLSYDEDLCDLTDTILTENGINVIAPAKVEEFLGDNAVTGVRLSNGQEILTDIVIIGIGANSNVQLAKKCQLPLGPTNAIQVNKHMQTDDPNIFACGDCVEKVSFFDGQPLPLKLASIACMEARIVGANLFETYRENKGSLGVWSTKIASTSFAGAGLTERIAKQKNYNIVIGTAEAINRHPGGMPGVAKLKVKLIFEKNTGIILGGQVSGAESSGELINTVSACIQQKMTINNIATFQIGTHPALTASPIAYQLVNAAEMALAANKNQ